MTVTARYLAWLESFTPSARQHLGLAAMETALLLAWAFLLDSMIRFATSAFLNLLPLTYLVAANILAWLEDPLVSKMADPMTAMGLAEVDSNGRRPPRWRTLLRLLITPPSFLLLLAGFLPVFRGRRSLPEVAAGVRLVLLEPSLDPRPIALILQRRRNNRSTVLGYTFLSLSIAVLIVLIPLGGATGAERAAAIAYPGLEEHDWELLTLYLDSSTRFPDSLEFHVRLASLYYRNSMLEDLAAELDAVERLDPDNAILLLRQDLPVDPASLLPLGSAFPELGELGFGPPPDTLPADSLGADSLGSNGTGAIQGPEPVADSIAAGPPPQMPGASQPPAGARESPTVEQQDPPL